jgi:hypothetical protein
MSFTSPNAGMVVQDHEDKCFEYLRNRIEYAIRERRGAYGRCNDWFGNSSFDRLLEECLKNADDRFLSRVERAGWQWRQCVLGLDFVGPLPVF